MNNEITNKIQSFLSKNSGRTYKAKELASQIRIKKVHYTEFRNILTNLVATGRVAKYKGSRYGLIKKATVIDGELHVKTQGYGFLITEEGKEDVFISQKNMGKAFNKDIVRVQLFAQDRGKSPEGRVIEVLERARSSIVGVYQKNKRYGFVVPDDLKISRDIYISQGDDLKAKSGQKVVVKVNQWLDERLNPEGEIVEILGFPDEPGVDVISVVKAFDLPTTFPEYVEQAAQHIPENIPQKEIERRMDLRDMKCITIDPKDAKDFDDAVSIEVLKNGHFQLGVHIADVGYFVNEKSPIDTEALKRGTSIYLVDRVIPMLPEKLSNRLCSLNPHEDRLTLSCFMEVAPDGKVVKYHIAESIIHSKKRFTYEEVQEIINNKNSSSEFADEIQQLFNLSKILIKKRTNLGSLDFNMPEVKVELDEKGLPISIKKQERLDSHRLIEECMLLANQTVTEHIALNLRKDQKSPPFIYRIHEEPATLKMDDFKKFVHALGYPLDPHKKVTAKLLGQFLAKLRGKPEEAIVEGLMLRSLMKAKYSTTNFGHFGLAFKHYTHFTSPIRRYPDLAVHRLLKMYQSKFDFAQVNKINEKLEYIAKTSSEREVVAVEAERESIKLKKVEYMQRHLGDEFSGVISGVMSFGIFVEISDILVEGLVHISDLEDDYYFHDEKNYSLIGQNAQKTYRLGDSVKVRVVRVDTDERVVDFLLV